MNDDEAGLARPDFALIMVDAIARIRVFTDQLPFTEAQKLDLMRGAYFGRLFTAKGYLTNLDTIGNTAIDDMMKAEGLELKQSISRYRAAMSPGGAKPEGVSLQ